MTCSRRAALCAQLSLLLAIALSASCGGSDGGDDHRSPDDGASYAIVPTTTKYLDAATLALLTSTSQDGATLTFGGSNALLDSIDVGDVVVAGPSTRMPWGFLRQVEAKDSASGEVVLDTRQATLEDAVEEGHFETATTLQTGDVQLLQGATGVVLRPAKLVEGMAALPERRFAIALTDVVLYDEDGDDATTDDQVTVGGEISFDTDLNLVIDITNFVLETFELTQTTAFRSELHFASGVALDDERKIELARTEFAPIVVPAGPIDLVFVPVLTLNVGLDGSIDAGIAFEGTQDATLQAGVTYDGTWHPVDELSSSFELTTPTVGANCAVQGYIGPELSVLLYGVVGPYASIRGYLELGASGQETASPAWALYAGLRFGLGVEIEVLGASLGSWEKDDIIDYRTLLASSDANVAEGWTVERVESCTVYGGSPSMTLDANAHPHIAYWCRDTETYEWELRYATLAYGLWSF